MHFSLSNLILNDPLQAAIAASPGLSGILFILKQTQVGRKMSIVTMVFREQDGFSFLAITSAPVPDVEVTKPWVIRY